MASFWLGVLGLLALYMYDNDMLEGSGQVSMKHDTCEGRFSGSQVLKPARANRRDLDMR